MKRDIKISEVIALLDAGKSREEIRDHFEMSNGDLTVLFKHPALKGKKAKKQRDFNIIDDTVENTFEDPNTHLETAEGDNGTEEVQTETTEDIPQSDTPWNN